MHTADSDTFWGSDGLDCFSLFKKILSQNSCNSNVQYNAVCAHIKRCLEENVSLEFVV